MQFYFVSTRRGSQFMTELLSAVSTATAEAGHPTHLALDRFPPLDEDCVYVVIPHEFRAWGDPDGLPDASQRARTIALCTENPGTQWFEETFELLSQFGAAVSINRSSAAELQRRGIPCEHLQLGYSRLWDTWLGDESVERNTDVLYLGAADPRRDPLVGWLGKSLWSRECQFLIPPLEPRTRSRPDFLTGAEKYHRLRSARLLLNLHRTTSSAFEWMRFLEAICNGCAVVTELSVDSDPLVAGEHFIELPVNRLGGAMSDLLDDPERLRRLRQCAYNFIRAELPMQTAGQRLAELAGDLSRSRSATGFAVGGTSAEGPPRASATAPNAIATAEVSARKGGKSLERAARLPRAAALATSIGKRLAARHTGSRLVAHTPAHTRSSPRVSVLCVVGDDRAEALQTLTRVPDWSYTDLEMLMIGQCSSAEWPAAVREFLDDHCSLPAALFENDAEVCVGALLNALVERARGDYLLILDAGAEIYPSTLQRLVTALEKDPRAAFAYPMVSVLDDGCPVELRGSLPWEPERLKRGNWIDAISLIRRERLQTLGSYSTDARLAGWEEFELWCRCAAVGEHGVHVAQPLAWRRLAPTAIPLASSDDETPAKWTIMRERFPQLLV
jgi:hypothetical protein